MCIVQFATTELREDTLQQQAASRDVYFVGESVTHWRHSYRLQKEAHHQNRIPSQRERHIKLLPVVSVDAADSLT
jgi:uncharacterized protein with HEPN domain